MNGGAHVSGGVFGIEAAGARVSGRSSGRSGSMQPSDLKGKVDFGIITIREDEFEAVLQRFPDRLGVVSGRRLYNLRRLAISDGREYTVAIVRCAAQGNGEAQ